MKSVRATKNADAELGPASLVVEIPAQVLRRVRQHARSSMDAEICGVFIGELKPDRTVVENVIAGECARQAGTHVTFTQETWAHVYELKDAKYPDKRIVGWYHSHPSFGIFLSEQDLFIHKNFFSDPQQVAWVFDPDSDEEGCFVWQDDEIVRLQRLLITDSEDHFANEPSREPKDDLLSKGLEQASILSQDSNARRWAAVIKWMVLGLSHLAALLIGVVLATVLSIRVVVIDRPALERAGGAHDTAARSAKRYNK